MATKKKRTTRTGGDAEADIRAEIAANPALAAGIHAELQRLAIARQVKQARQRKKLTQEQLAEKADTAQAVIARIEKGKIPKLDLLNKVAQALGCRLDVTLVPLKKRSV
jgi:DNA-binding XRE family transcriptional regulator